MCGVERVAISFGGGVGDEESRIAVGGSPVAVTRVNVDAMVGASGADPSGEGGALGAQAHKINVQKRTALTSFIILT